MKVNKSSKNKVQNEGTHGKEPAVSCTPSVHHDIVLDANEALHNILGRLVKLEAEIEPIKIENKNLKRRNEYLEVQHRQDLNTIRKQEITINSLKTRLDKLEKPQKNSHSSIPPSTEDILS